MNKQEWLGMGYVQLETKDDEAMDTIYKKFDNGNVWIVQFNEEVKDEEVGKIYLKADQFNKLFN